MSKWKNYIKKEVKGLPLLILVVLVLRSFVVSTSYIPSGSMVPTLQVGDVLMISRFTYGFSQFSVPFGYLLPRWGKKVLAYHTPQRGDVVVFRLPDNNSVDFVKRVVGLPGDKIAIIEGKIVLNGTVMTTDFMQSLPQGGAILRRTTGNRNHLMLKTYQNGMGPADDMQEITVPPGHYFMIGDCFDNSQDSRYSHVVGTIPADHIIGRVEIILGSYSYKSTWPTWQGIPYPPVQWQRFFQWVH